MSAKRNVVLLIFHFRDFRARVKLSGVLLIFARAVHVENVAMDLMNMRGKGLRLIFTTLVQLL